MTAVSLLLAYTFPVLLLMSAYHSFLTLSSYIYIRQYNYGINACMLNHAAHPCIQSGLVFRLFFLRLRKAAQAIDLGGVEFGFKSKNKFDIPDEDNPDGLRSPRPLAYRVEYTDPPTTVPFPREFEVMSAHASNLYHNKSTSGYMHSVTYIHSYGTLLSSHPHRRPQIYRGRGRPRGHGGARSLIYGNDHEQDNLVMVYNCRLRGLQSPAEPLPLLLPPLSRLSARWFCIHTAAVCTRACSHPTPSPTLSRKYRGSGSCSSACTGTTLRIK